MAIAIWEEDLGRELLRLCQGSKQRICIVSPFLSKSVIHELCELIVLEKLDCVVVTRLDLNDCAAGASDLEAIGELLKNNVTVIGYQDLHTKLYLFDDAKAVIGSANFTTAGLGKNFELLVCLDDKDAVAKLAAYAAELCKYGNKVQPGDVDRWKQELKARKEAIKELHWKRLKDYGKCKKRKPTNGFRWKKTAAPTVWLKLVGRSSDRKQREEDGRVHWPTKDGTPGYDMIGFGANRTPKAKKGDIIYICLLTVNEKGKNDRFIVAKTVSKGFDRDQPKKEAFAQLHQDDPEWKWPVYLELEQIQGLRDGKLPREGMPLAELWAHSGQHSASYNFRGGWERLNEESVRYLEERDDMFEMPEDA